MSRERPVRVAHLVPRFGVGGMEVGIAKIVNGFDRAHVASVICSFETAVPPRPVLRPDVPVHELHRAPGNNPRLVLQLARWFREAGVDIVHTHSWGTLVEGSLAARLARVPHLVHGEHGTMDVRPRNLRVQRWVWGRADRVLAVSRRLADKMAATTGFPRERIVTIHNGADVARFASVPRASARQAAGVSEGEFVLGIVGRLVDVKDHETLIAAVSRLAQRGVPVRALVAGDGPLLARLRDCAAAGGVSDRVVFLGHRADVEQVFAALDVYVQTSVSEGLPNTVMEAMASGVSVVATDVGGTSELVEDGVTGLLVPPRDPDRLADVLASLARDRAGLEAMGRSGRERAIERFGLAKMIQAYEALYLDVARGRAWRGGVMKAAL